MGGPVQDVLLRTAMGPQQARALVQEVANALGFTVRSPQGRLDPARLCEVEAPWDRSGSDVLLLPAEQEREPGELDALTRACGFRPAGALQVSGWARRGSSEQGRFLAALAQAGGDLLIDMNGPVAPPACGEEVTRKKIRTYVKGRPGVVHELSDVTAGGETAIYHVVDASFLLAWLKDPDFHLPN